MGKVFLDLAMSLDGFISGPNNDDSGLHDWYFSETGKSQHIIDELLNDIGAMILGKKTFGTQPDGFDTPYKMPHFVLLTNLEPQFLEMECSLFSFLTASKAP
jgi:dihydrofolate reductase